MPKKEKSMLIVVSSTRKFKHGVFPLNEKGERDADSYARKLEQKNNESFLIIRK